MSPRTKKPQKRQQAQVISPTARSTLFLLRPDRQPQLSKPRIQATNHSAPPVLLTMPLYLYKGTADGAQPGPGPNQGPTAQWPGQDAGSCKLPIQSTTTGFAWTVAAALSLWKSCGTLVQLCGTLPHSHPDHRNPRRRLLALGITSQPSQNLVEPSGPPRITG